MKNVVFKNILICDVQKHTAHFQEFSEGINVITSEENHVGKSSLLKSLYYALGAEVEFDTVWDKNTKMYMVEIGIDSDCYTFVRYQRNFAVFSGNQICLLTKSVSRDLAQYYEKILNFSIYLPNKETKKAELAPPVFSFMPYYIDQDTGWTGLYKSFSSIDQYKKGDREKSLYYHLNIYNKKTIELLGEKDRLKEEIDQLKKQQEKLKITIEAISEEISNLLPAESIDELERNLIIPKENIAQIVAKIGELRNKIQALETTLQQHEHQLNIIREYHKIKNKPVVEDIKIHECPRCGYSFDEELHDMVREHYNSSNEEYMCQQIQLIIDSISDELNKYKKDYVDLMKKLEEQETAFDEKQDTYDLYIKQRGMQKSLSDFTSQLAENVLKQSENDDEIKRIGKELKKLPDKKKIEEKYIEFVKQNIIKLGAWNSAYDGQIKLIKPMKAQGTLENKIILAQVIGLFQTMDSINSEVVRFPFVIDSPRSKEPSHSSSKEILKLIFETTGISQIILATMDFEDFEADMLRRARVSKLTEERSLLKKETYDNYSEKINEMYNLLNNIK